MFKYLYPLACSALICTVGCELTDWGSDDSGGGVAERSNYTTIDKWDRENSIATLEDGFKVIVIPGNGSVQRDSCSWEDTVESDFVNAVSSGQLVYYKVYISGDFVPGEPLTANQFTIVNLECFRQNPTTCGPVNVP